MLGKRIYFDKNKRSIKSKDDKDILVYKSIKLCEQYDVGLSRQQIK